MINIILTGPRHCGKTTVGKILASLLAFEASCDFFDIDELIFKRTGKTPRQLYNEGADVFHKAEADSLQSLDYTIGASKRSVIAAGGGIIDNSEAVSILKNFDAVKIFLNISAAAAWERISAAGELPPFLRTADPQETHRLLHERRSAAYLQLADMVIEAEGKTPMAIAEEIISRLSR